MSEFIANNPAWHPLNVGKQVVDRLYLAFRTPRRELCPGPLDQVVEVSL